MTHRFLTPSQVAETLQIQERTVTRWLREGYLRGFKLGKEWRIDSADLERFIEAGANHEPVLVTVSARHQDFNGAKARVQPCWISAINLPTSTAGIEAPVVAAAGVFLYQPYNLSRTDTHFIVPLGVGSFSNGVGALRTTKKPMLTAAQVSEILQIDQQTVRQWLREGSLLGYKVGSEWRIEPHDLHIFLEAHANIPRADVVLLH